MSPGVYLRGISFSRAETAKPAEKLPGKCFDTGAAPCR
jgi:hypothetical protein